MGLMSVMQTGLTGISAAEATLDAVANNLANSQTVGYKQSFPQFATQPPQTQSLGSGPSGTSGGTTPLQSGRGVQVAEVAIDFSQGPLVITSNSNDLAIQGDGYFVLQTTGGERTYTRNGQFKLNSQRQLVTPEGDRVLGYAVDENGNLNTGELVPIEISDAEVRAGDGTAARLVNYAIGRDGRVLGKYSDGMVRTLGQLPVARFNDPNGLIARGGNKYSEGVSSGLAEIGAAESSGAGSIISGATELSNTDIGENLVAMVLARNQFRPNWQVVNTSSELLEGLVEVQRR